MSRTSVPCDSDTKADLEDVKQDDETWDDTLQRLAALAAGEVPDDVREDAVADEVDALMERLDSLDTSLDEILDAVEAVDGASGESGDSDLDRVLNELRETIRLEVKNGVEAALSQHH